MSDCAPNWHHQRAFPARWRSRRRRRRRTRGRAPNRRPFSRLLPWPRSHCTLSCVRPRRRRASRFPPHLIRATDCQQRPWFSRTTRFPPHGRALTTRAGCVADPPSCGGASRPSPRASWSGLLRGPHGGTAIREGRPARPSPTRNRENRRRRRTFRTGHY